MIDNRTDMNPKERLGEEIATLAARIDAATYELLVLIRTFDEHEGWNNGFLSCAHWLTWRIGLAPSAARERVRVARALGELPLMSEAMKRGQLSYSKVRALTRIARPDTEESLVDLGRTGTAAHIERMVRAWRRADRTIEAHDDELRDAASHVGIQIDENGMFVIRGRLAPEVGEVLTKALDAASEKLYDRGRGKAKDADRPPAGKLRADALALVAESALAGGLDPGASADRYQVVVHVNEDELKAPEDTTAVEHRSRVSAETPSAREVGRGLRGWMQRPCFRGNARRPQGGPPGERDADHQPIPLRRLAWRLSRPCFRGNSPAHSLRRRQGANEPPKRRDPERRPQDAHHSAADSAGSGVPGSRMPLPRLHFPALRRSSRPPLGRWRRNEALEPGASVSPAPPSAARRRLRGADGG